MLELMYITNNVEIAKIAQESGVDRIFIDMEYIGKEERQKGLDTVKCKHTVSDIKRIKQIMNKSKLLVRVNPIHEATEDYCSSKDEINQVISAGADIVMLPMFKTANDVKIFLDIINKRVKTILLLENKEAVENIDQIIKLDGIDEIHIGLNDLHLSYKKKFMFELLTDGTVEKICNILNKNNIKYGFGGIARIGHGYLPAEYIITEHYALNSRMAILSRSFCDANKESDLASIKEKFESGIKSIRSKEEEISKYTKSQFEENHKKVCQIVNNIVEGL